MNKEELIKEYDEKAKALRDEFISKLEDDKKEFELTYPEDEEVVYLADCEVTSVLYDAVDKADKRIFEHGLYFNTEQEAEQSLKERKLLFKLHQYAKEKNEGWQPDWSSWSEDKYYIFYNYGCCEFKTSSTIISDDFKKLPYFKTREIAQACVDEFGKEIKEVLVNGY
ncbi:hypothetical protein [Gemella sanguinis]|uniref:hypothetical protein n=1 Tax=Gemella sanguinis TaxID=84135 RepID=UPI0028D44334|nr:hypothetical protein [Gemella sanguinis]